MFAQIPPTPTDLNGKTWLVWLAIVTGIIATMCVGRIIQALRNGAGLKDAFMSVWLGTNAPSKPEDKPQDPTNKLGLFVVIGLLAFTFGCGTSKFQEGGAYSGVVVVPGVSTNQVSEPETILYYNDEAHKLAYDTVIGIYHFEQANRAYLSQKLPGLRPFLADLAPKIEEIEKRWAVARTAYKLNPVPTNLTQLQRAVAEIQRLVPVVVAESTIKPN